MSRQVESFEQRLRAVMAEQGVSSASLARRLRIGERTVARWRAGETEPSFPVKQSIGVALGYGMNPSWFERESAEAAA